MNGRDENNFHFPKKKSIRKTFMQCLNGAIKFFFLSLFETAAAAARGLDEIKRNVLT